MNDGQDSPSHYGQPYFAYEQIRKNKFKSMLLVGLMISLIVEASMLIGYLNGDFRLGFWIGVGVSAVLIPIQMLSGRQVILMMTKGKPLYLHDPRQRRLQHLVEGLALAAGLKRTPDVYLLSSRVPNAFASGTSEKNAFIGVTVALLNELDDQELEGVVAHEISHIVHRDILLAQLVVSLVSVVICLAYVLELTARVQPSLRMDRPRGKMNFGLLFVIASLLALLARPIMWLAATAIQSAISRKREFAADAYAVQLCNYNEGLARALEKISAKQYTTWGDFDSLGGKQLACLYIDFPGQNYNNLFSTHPPVAERVRILRNLY